MKKPGHRRTILLLTLLAVLCIGAAELFVCSRVDPALYESLVSPVRRTAHAAAVFCAESARRTGEAVKQTASDLSRRAAEAAQRLDEKLRRSHEAMEHTWEERKAPPAEPSGQPSPEVPDLPAAAPEVEKPLTELRTERGRDILTGGIVDIVYFNQSEEPWADAPYGSDTLLKYGCGPTAMAMAVASLTEEDTDPARMAQWAVEHGHWARQNGSYHSLIPGAAEAFGLTVESPVEQTPQTLCDALGQGRLLVALMKPGHFTKYGHFILLRGITPDGNILVADPNSIPNSLAVWDPQLILDELAGSNSSGAPLWALSAGPA